MLGFIGTGNMAVAMIEGILRGGVCQPYEIVVDRHRARAQELQERLNIRLCESPDEMVNQCDTLILAVKPYVVEKALAPIRDQLKNRVILSVVAGWTTEQLLQAAPGARVLRAMPNTPALVGEGMTALSLACTLSDEQKRSAERIFSSFGRITWVEEHLMEAVTGVSGSGPAYAFLFLEAMADGGVQMGLPRKVALEMAAQTLLGAAKLALETHEHPGVLKDMVCSPGGTTIAAVHALEKAGFRGTVMDAVAASTKRALDMKG